MPSGERSTVFSGFCAPALRGATCPRDTAIGIRSLCASHAGASSACGMPHSKPWRVLGHQPTRSGLVRDLATGLGLTGLVVSPAFGYAGVGFPALGMNAFAQLWGAILPLRWYMAVLLGQAARGLPLYDSARPFAMLAGLAILYMLLAFLGLRALARSTARAAAEAEQVATVAAPRGLGGEFAAEWRRVLGVRGAFALLVLGPLVYGIYYPQPYLNQILRKIPIVVVDNDLSELSRNIVQTLDASGAVKVVARAETLADAQAMLDRGRAFAVVGIPPG